MLSSGEPLPSGANFCGNTSPSPCSQCKIFHPGTVKHTNVHRGRATLYAETTPNSLTEPDYTIRSPPVTLRSNGVSEDMFDVSCDKCSTLGAKDGKDGLSDLTPQLLLDQNQMSRASLASSAWGSLRMSMQNFSRAALHVFLVVPCSRHRCCVGCVSLRDAVALICVAELIIIALCSLIAVDIYLTDGRMFYTKEVEGKGTAVAIGFGAFFLISVPIIIITLVAWHLRKPTLYIIHVLWQWTVLELLLFFSYGVLKRVFSPDLLMRTGFLLPSAVLLSIVGVIGIVVQTWWTFVFVDAMFFEMAGKNFPRQKRSVASKYGENDDDEETSSIDSRHQSFKIPVVKVDHSKSMDAVSIGDTRIAALTRAKETAELTDVVVV